ncbi:MAG: Uma2 family endonuclease [Bacteroidetes bacterium SW_9_63_38]|nr:MAG: Uma2 family endonuclease [Bacteroidetes bacterium SW_9_63_38]
MPTTADPLTSPKRRRFTVDEYYRMGEAGVFGDDDRVELLDGHIYVMSPIGSEHAACIDRLTRLFVPRAAENAIVRVQNPIRLETDSEPEPDLALVTPGDGAYVSQHPGPADTLLVIEVADTSLAFDRDVKLPVYADADLPEVWLVDLEHKQIHVYRDPSGDGYTTHEVHDTDDALTVEALPDIGSVSASAILKPTQSDE